VIGGENMLNWLSKKFTNSYNEVPLFFVTFNLNKFKESGAKGSCETKLHPSIKDEYVKNQLNELIDYIREKYDMEELSK
jgi:hypothetical protein